MSDRMLPAKLPGPAFGPQAVPQTLLRIGDVAAQGRAAMVRCRGGIGPTSPRPSPPRGAEREFTPVLASDV
jgi:hypothetical protein